jgi:acyl carrier protein
MQDSEVYADLTDIFREVFLRDDITLKPDLTAKDIAGWDSFKQIEIIIAVEEKYGFKLHTRELDSLHNVGDLARVVQSKAGVAKAGA